MGFLAPTVLGAGGTYSAVEASDAASCNAFKVPTSNPSQYFLIENRQLTGFDSGLYRWFWFTSGGAGGGGLAIWHVDESKANNTDETHKKVDLEEANEGIVGHSELDYNDNRGNRHHYYYSSHITLFDDATTPNTRLYDGSSTAIAVSDVSAAGATMSFLLSMPKAGSTTVTELRDLTGNPVVEIPLGDCVTDTATVVGLAPPHPVPSGTVDFQVSSDAGATWTTYDAGVALDAGEATSDQYCPLATGQHWFRAIYSGDDNYNASQSGDLDEPLLVSAEEFELALSGGWNLVSIPVEPLDPSRDAVFPPPIIVAVWQYNNPGGYAVPAEIHPKKGYWVNATEATTLTIWGIRPTDTSVALSTGWNLIGVVGPAPGVCQPVPPCPPACIIWQYNSPGGYVVPLELCDGHGFWVLASEDTVIWSGGP